MTIIMYVFYPEAKFSAFYFLRFGGIYRLLLPMQLILIISFNLDSKFLPNMNLSSLSGFKLVNKSIRQHYDSKTIIFLSSADY